MALARQFKTLGRFKKTPKDLRAEQVDTQCECQCSNCMNGDCEDCDNAQCEDSNCEDCPMQAGQSAEDAASASASAAGITESDLSFYEAQVALRSRKPISNPQAAQ
jgi:hypothetical protein